MSITYKGPDGRLYRVSERPDAEGLYYIEYRDPAASAVYKPLPGYDRSTNRAEVVEWLDELAKDRGLGAVTVEDKPTAKPAAPEKPKGTGVWLYGDHRVMRVGIGNDTDRSDCRYYHVLVLNLLAAKPQWRKLSGTGNYDHKHLAEADAELRETLPEDARELTVAEAEQLFTSPATDWVDLVPDADKAWDKIMAGTKPATKPVSDPEPIPEWAIPVAQEFVRNDWVRDLEDFSAAALRASKEAFAHAGGTCGPGFADTSPKGIKLWEDAPGHGIEYTWTKFVQACKAMGIDPKAPEPAASPASAPAAEPQEANVVQPTPEPAALAVPPAADIAAPGFDFSALGDLAEQAAEDDAQFNLHYGRAQDEYLISCVYLARIHDLTAKAGRYGGGTWTKWYESKGISEGSARAMVATGDGFKSATVADLKNLPVLTRKDLRLIAGTGAAEAVVEASKAGDDSKVQELLAQLKATEEAKAAAERKVKGLQTSYNTAHANEEYNIGLRKKAEEAAEDLKQKLYRRNEELAKKEQMLNVTMDQQGMYIAKMQEQDEMLAELQDRLDDANAQLRNPQLEATVVDQDELERRARELAEQKIAEAEARAAEAGQAPTAEEITKLANGYAAQIDGMRAVLTQLTQGMDRQAVTHAADKLCLAADRLHDLIALEI